PSSGACRRSPCRWRRWQDVRLGCRSSPGGDRTLACSTWLWRSKRSSGAGSVLPEEGERGLAAKAVSPRSLHPLAWLHSFTAALSWKCLIPGGWYGKVYFYPLRGRLLGDKDEEEEAGRRMGRLQDEPRWTAGRQRRLRAGRVGGDGEAAARPPHAHPRW